MLYYYKFKNQKLFDEYNKVLKTTFEESQWQYRKTITKIAFLLEFETIFHVNVIQIKTSTKDEDQRYRILAIYLLLKYSNVDTKFIINEFNISLKYVESINKDEKYQEIYIDEIKLFVERLKNNRLYNLKKDYRSETILKPKDLEQDNIFVKLCHILAVENNCLDMIKNFKKDFYNINHLKLLYTLTLLELFNGEWIELDTDIFYEHFKNITRDRDLSDDEFVESYCYAISVIVKSWIRFSLNPEAKNIKVFNENIEIFNAVLKKFRKIIKQKTIDDETFNLIQNGFLFKKIKR